MNVNSGEKPEQAAEDRRSAPTIAPRPKAPMPQHSRPDEGSDFGAEYEAQKTEFGDADAADAIVSNDYKGD